MRAKAAAKAEKVRVRAEEQRVVAAQQERAYSQALHALLYPPPHTPSETEKMLMEDQVYR